MSSLYHMILLISSLALGAAFTFSHIPWGILHKLLRCLQRRAVYSLFLSYCTGQAFNSVPWRRRVRAQLCLWGRGVGVHPAASMTLAVQDVPFCLWFAKSFNHKWDWILSSFFNHLRRFYDFSNLACWWGEFHWLISNVDHPGTNPAWSRCANHSFSYIMNSVC